MKQSRKSITRQSALQKGQCSYTHAQAAKVAAAVKRAGQGTTHPQARSTTFNSNDHNDFKKEEHGLEGELRYTVRNREYDNTGQYQPYLGREKKGRITKNKIMT